MLEPSFSEDQDIFVFFISFYNFDMIVSYFGHAGTFRGSSNLEKIYWQKNDTQEHMLRFLNKLNFNK